MAMNPSAWGLIIIGLILIIIMWYGIPMIPPLELIGTVLFWIGVVLLIIGIILLVVGLIRGATGT